MEVDVPGDIAKSILGKSGCSKSRLERSTGAQIRIDLPQAEDDWGTVVTKGTRRQVDCVLNEISKEVARRSELIAKQLAPIFKDLSLSFGTEGRNQAGASVRKGQTRVLQWTDKHIDVDLEVLAPKPAVKCLIGRDDKRNVTKIREDFKVKIEIQDANQGKEFQKVHISGPIENTLQATEEVKKSLEGYQPEFDLSNDPSRWDKKNLTRIKANAKVFILKAAAGFLVGRCGSVIYKIKDATAVEFMEVDKKEDGSGFKCVNVSGYIAPVLRAIKRVQIQMQEFCRRESKHVLSLKTTEDVQMAPIARSASPDSRQTDAMQTSEESAMPVTSHPAPQPASNAVLPDLGQEVVVCDAHGNAVRLIREFDGRYKPVLDVCRQWLFTQSNLRPNADSNPEAIQGTPPGFEMFASTRQQRDALANPWFESGP